MEHTNPPASEIDLKISDLQSQIDDMALILLHMKGGPQEPDPVEQFESEPVDILDEALVEEEARQATVAMKIILGFLSRQWLPPDVQAAFEYVRKELEYNG